MNVLAKDHKDVVKDVTLASRNRGAGTCMSAGGIRDVDGITTDLGIRSDEILPGTLSDGSHLDQHGLNMNSSPLITNQVTAGVKISRDINMWN